jgi:hypothetical protein
MEHHYDRSMLNNLEERQTLVRPYPRSNADRWIVIDRSDPQDLIHRGSAFAPTESNPGPAAIFGDEREAGRFQHLHGRRHRVHVRGDRADRPFEALDRIDRYPGLLR